MARKILVCVAFAVVVLYFGFVTLLVIDKEKRLQQKDVPTYKKVVVRGKIERKYPPPYIIKLGEGGGEEWIE